MHVLLAYYTLYVCVIQCIIVVLFVFPMKMTFLYIVTMKLKLHKDTEYQQRFH